MTTSLQTPVAESRDSLQRFARTAGALFLVLLVLGPFSIMYVPGQLMVGGDATATAANVVESENLLRSGIVSDVVIFLTEIAMAVVLYMLFRAVSKPLALIAMLSRVAQANVMALNVLCYLAILVLVGDQADLSAIANGERDSLVMALFTTHEYGVHVGQLFFGFSLVFLGLLAYRSVIVPPMLGALVIVAASGYLTDSFANLVVPQLADLTSVLVVITSLVGELPLFLWLLMRGVRPSTGS